jgi:hypothetical protein
MVPAKPAAAGPEEELGLAEKLISATAITYQVCLFLAFVNYRIVS